jgi:predicted DNA-binding protein YlxM (UPF0122 family)
VSRLGRPPRLSEREKHELRLYREAGVSIAHLAGMWHVSTKTVYDILAELRAKLGPERLPAHKQHLARKQLYSQSVPQDAPEETLRNS